MNQITVNFNECSPAPADGYNVTWRVAGSGTLLINQGNFPSSPAVFTDSAHPDGTQYEGYVRSNLGTRLCNPVFWTTDPGDNSGCGTIIQQITSDPAYVNLGYFDLDITGSLHVDLNWAVYDRPNRFTLYDNGAPSTSTGWKGIAAYGGPWGASLSTATSGTIGFNPAVGHTYKLLIEVGNADTNNPLDDSFEVNIICTP